MNLRLKMSKIWTPWYIYINDEKGHWIPAPQALYDEVMCKEIQDDGEWMTLDVATDKVFSQWTRHQMQLRKLR